MANDTRSTAVRKPGPYVDDDWMSVRQASLALECSPQTVYNRALRGELETMQLGGRHFVSRASVNRAILAQDA